MKKMKQKLSITIEEDKIKQIETMLKEGRFRNKSRETSSYKRKGRRYNN